MPPWPWVTPAVRSCLDFKCSQPDCSCPYCDGGGEGFQRPTLLLYTFKGSYKSKHLLALEESIGKKVFP